MGQAILYCFRCSTQLREVQFEQGKAYRIDHWVCCDKCAPEAIKSLPPDRAKVLQSLITTPKQKSSATIPALTSSSRAMPPVASSPRIEPVKPRNPWILVGIVGVLVVVFALAFLFRDEKKPVETEITPPSTTVKPPPKDSAAQLALKDAQQFAREHPDDLDGQLKRYGDLGLISDKTAAGSEARKAVEALRAREQEMADRLAKALEAELEAPLKREEYGAVLRSLDSAKSRMGGARWTFLLEKRDGEVRARMRKQFDALRTQAADAKKAGKKSGVQDLTERVRGWGLTSLSSEWDAALAAVPEPPPPPPPPPPKLSPEATAYQARWEVAMLRAAGRDFSGAITELQKAAEGLKEKALQDEAAQDVRDFQDADRAVQAAITALSAARQVTLTAIDGRSGSGRVLAADADRVELYVEARQPTVFFEWSEVNTASLLREQPREPRPTALLRTLEGEPRGDELPAKYAAWAESGKAKAGQPSAEEQQARALYYDAERDFRGMATREKSVEAYKSLKQKFKDTSLVRRAAARIDRRIDSGKEYYFLGSDLAGSGTFALSRDGKLESIADSDPAQANRNGAEWEYLALASQTYRCWALVGGCCVDAFTFHYQATGLTETNPKTKKKAPAEPGGDLASPVKHTIKNLKSHPKGEPKKATRWEWVEILLPKSAPGLKKVRLLTDQQGFGVAAVVVSATRTKAPSDAEAAELAKQRALDAVPVWAQDRPGMSARILLDDFDKEPSGWKYIGGQEFPGATGSLTIDKTTGHEGKGSYHLVGDFSGGGGYVGTWKDLPQRSLTELRIWIKAPNVRMIMVRLVDGTDQCHQRHVILTPSDDWQEVVLKFAGVQDQDRWGGPADGVWRGIAKGYALNITSGSFNGGAKKGELWIDDVEGVLADNPADR
jgi:hypothetical protein